MSCSRCPQVRPFADPSFNHHASTILLSFSTLRDTGTHPAVPDLHLACLVAHTVSCRDDSYKLLRGLLIALLVLFVVGVPVLFAALLCRRQRKAGFAPVNGAGVGVADEAAAVADGGALAFLSGVVVLPCPASWPLRTEQCFASVHCVSCAEAYRPELYFFEAISMLRRVALVAVSVLITNGALCRGSLCSRRRTVVRFSACRSLLRCVCCVFTDNQLRAQCVSLLCLALLLLQQWLRPYRSPSVNSHEARCLIALCVVAVSPGSRMTPAFSQSHRRVPFVCSQTLSDPTAFQDRPAQGVVVTLVVLGIVAAFLVPLLARRCCPRRLLLRMRFDSGIVPRLGDRAAAGDEEDREPEHGPRQGVQLQQPLLEPVL